MHNTFVIGDIHGGLAALKQVLERAPIKPEDTLIFLGDYVDGWPESFGVIEFLIALAKKQTCIFLKGNHDACFETWLTTGVLPDSSYHYGGKATLASYSHATEKQLQEHLKFYQALRYYYVDTANRLFVHAGFTSLHGPQQEHNQEMLIWDRTLWEMALAMDATLTHDSPYYPKRLKLFSEIFIGHTPTVRINRFDPVNVHNVWNIDTGAAFTGSLTLLDVNTKAYWQSDAVQSLYPNVTGRQV
jgi:serine/threonine protein phosphatase 1